MFTVKNTVFAVFPVVLKLFENCPRLFADSLPPAPSPFCKLFLCHSAARYGMSVRKAGDTVRLVRRSWVPGFAPNYDDQKMASVTNLFRTFFTQIKGKMARKKLSKRQ